MLRTLPAPPSANRYEMIYSVVARIPRGRVATYGQVARLAGLAGHARLVGYALSALEGISARGDGGPMSDVQRLRLERERVRFDEGLSLPLDVFRWRPR